MRNWLCYITPNALVNLLIYDKKYSDHAGLLEIECPCNRRNSSLADILNDQSCYIQQNNNVSPEHELNLITNILKK